MPDPKRGVERRLGTKPRVYVSHASKTVEFNRYYRALRTCNAADFILPHEKSPDGVPSQEIIENSDLFIAFMEGESEGRTIEINWAKEAEIPIILIYPSNLPIPNSVTLLAIEDPTITILQYEKLSDVLAWIEENPPKLRVSQ